MSSYGYKDNYPHNIEAPQRVNFQYSRDIIFDYSNGKYPLGETHEGFLWEDAYNPTEHYVGDELVGKHVWMRTSVGLNSDWTLPMRLTDSFTNIEQSEVIYDSSSGEVTYTIKYTLYDGTIIYSDPIIIVNGVDGVGIEDASIVGNNLIITYTNDVIDDLGRVVGYDGTGVPIGSPDGYHLVSIGDVPIWQDFNTLLNSELSANSPLDFTASLLTHLDTDGNRHIPVGGNSGDSLITDGAGNYSWDAHILLSDLDDTATTGATDKVYSADKILSLLGGSAFGIKYSVNTIVERDAIVGMVADELCVVNDEPNRPVFKYDGANWISFFDLDATHDHDDRYYTESELGSSGAASYVHWDKVFSKPTFYADWTIAGDTGSTDISDGETLSILGGSGVTTALVGNTLTISAAGTTYTAGVGLDLIGTEFRHEDTSSVADTTNLNGVVIQNLTFDTFGHVLTRTSFNLDGRYSLLGHTHTNSDNTETIKVIIDGWDMQTDGTKIINITGLGLTMTDIINATAWVRPDTTANIHSNLSRYGDGDVYWGVATSEIVLSRTSGGDYDSATYNDDTFDRGWVTITYLL